MKVSTIIVLAGYLGGVALCVEPMKSIARKHATSKTGYATLMFIGPATWPVWVAVGAVDNITRGGKSK